MTIQRPASDHRKHLPSAVADQFDRWAPTYDRCRLARWYQAQALAVLAHARLPGGGSVLDVGCGTGWALRHLARARPDVTGFGVDISSGMIVAAQAASHREGLANLRFRTLDWEDDGAARPDLCDVVLCISAFHYFADPLRALRRMRSALRPGGQLLILERATDNSLLTKVWDVAHRWVIRDHVGFHSSGKLQSWTQEAGFADAKLLARHRRLFWKGKLYSSLLVMEAKAPVAELAQ